MENTEYARAKKDFQSVGVSGSISFWTVSAWVVRMHDKRLNGDEKKTFFSVDWMYLRNVWDLNFVPRQLKTYVLSRVLLVSAFLFVLVLQLLKNIVCPHTFPFDLDAHTLSLEHTHICTTRMHTHTFMHSARFSVFACFKTIEKYEHYGMVQ